MKLKIDKFLNKVREKDSSAGTGNGDMLKATYDPTNKNQDMFAYADSLVAGLLDFRGGYDASGNTFPATGGSGTAGAILKGDTWAISVAGTLGGVAIQVGDVILATVDSPGQTTGSWTKLNTNVSYVPEDQSNKETSVLDTSTTKYPCNNVVKTAVDGKVPTSRQLTINGTAYDLSADRSWTISAGGTYWTAVPGTPTRVNNTQFGLTGNYSNLISRGTVLKRDESGTPKQAMVVTSVYTTSTLITLVGDVLVSGFSDMKYGAVKAREITFAYLPTVGTGTDIMGRWFAGEKTKVHGAIAYHGTAGTTGNTTYDVLKNGTSRIFATTPVYVTVASGATVGTDTSTVDGTSMNENEYLTISCIAVSSSAPSYATIKVFVSPFNDIYLS